MVGMRMRSFVGKQLSLMFFLLMAEISHACPAFVDSVAHLSKDSVVASTAFMAASPIKVDTLGLSKDSLQPLVAHADSLVNQIKRPVKLTPRVPDPQRALWLALVLPGGGQIYNRKFWKLPIIYGGFVGCTYALMWNQQMYKDYSQAYIDIMDDDPNTKSYLNMLPYGYDISGREDQFKNIFRRKKDFYRKNRDLSIFAFFGVYILSVIDAYVDAQLSTFDISPDLSMKVEPTLIEQKNLCNMHRSKAVGVQCSLTF